MPKLSTVNPPALGQTVLTNAPATDNKLPNDTITQATVKYDQLRLDLGQLATNTKTHEQTCARDHTFTWSMETRRDWWDRHATISKHLVEIDGVAKLHNLADLRARIADTRAETVALSSRVETITLNIEAAPTKSYSGDASKAHEPGNNVPLSDVATAEKDGLDYGTGGEGLIGQLIDGHTPPLVGDDQGRAPALTNPADHIVSQRTNSLPRTVRTLGMVHKFISIFREKWDPGYGTALNLAMPTSGLGTLTGHPVIPGKKRRGA